MCVCGGGGGGGGVQGACVPSPNIIILLSCLLSCVQDSGNSFTSESEPVNSPLACKSDELKLEYHDYPE